MVQLLILLGAAQGLFLSLLLIGKRSDRTASLLLAALMIVLSIMLVGISLQTNPDFSSILPAHPHLYGIIDPLPFLLGPLLYLYARLLLNTNERLGPKDLLHLIPFLLCIIYFMPFYALSAAEKWSYIKDARAISHSPDLIAGLRVVHGLIYTFICNKLFRAGIRNNKRSAHPVEMSKMKWLGQFAQALFVLWSILAALLLSKNLGIKTFPNLDLWICILISGGLYTIGYIGLRSNIIFIDPSDKRSNAEKYKNSGLTAELSANYIDRLVTGMTEKKLYKENELTLKSLAELISISPNHLSQIINEHFHRSFHDFVNEYRVQEAKQLIVSVAGGNLKLLSIAFEVGFNSKSTFNAAFRKLAGMSPSEFRKKGSASCADE